MNFLVTGVAGFIGSHIAYSLIDMGFNVTGIDNLSSGKRHNIRLIEDHKNFNMITGDIRNDDYLESCFKNKIDYVFHLAAEPSVTKSIEDPTNNFYNTTYITSLLLEQSMRNNVKRFIFSGSSSAYGNSKEEIKSESILPQPISPYAGHKVASEFIIKSFTESYGMDSVILRYFNVFGPKQDPNSHYSGVISKFFKHYIEGTTPVIYGDGEQTRDFVFVKDVVYANIKAALLEKNLNGEVINIGSGVPTSLNGLISHFHELTGNDMKPKYEEARVGDIKNSLANIEKAKQILNFKPTDLNIGLLRTFNYYKKAFSINNII